MRTEVGSRLDGTGLLVADGAQVDPGASLQQAEAQQNRNRADMGNEQI